MTCRYSAEISRRSKFLAITNSGSERQLEESAFRFSTWTVQSCSSLSVAVNAALVGANRFVKIELWAR
jgi:hypothetical protein